MEMKKPIYNIIASIVTQLVSIIIALMIPRLLITIYGSEINGIVSTINQIVRYFAILEGGVSVAACVSLYMPMYEKKYIEVNKILSAVKKFYLRSGLIFAFVSVLLAFIFPLSLIDSGMYSIGFFIVIILLSMSVVGYLFFLKYNLVLFANGQQYIILIFSSASNFLVALLQLYLISKNASIILLVCVTPIITILRLFLLMVYTKRKFPFINFNEEPNSKAIEQKWSAITVNLSNTLKTVVPITYLTLMYDFKILSIFTLYSTIFHVGSSIISTMGNGLTASLGRLVVSKEIRVVKDVYNISSNIMFALVSLLSICFGVLMFPFLDIYIGTDTDINYKIPLLLFSFIINEAISNLRFAPDMLIKATGHIEQTSKSSIIEIIISIILTPIGCLMFGYSGVLLGSIISGLYRTVYITLYSVRNILGSNLNSITINMVVYALYSVAMLVILSNFNFENISIYSWILLSIILTTIIMIFIVIIEIFILKRDIKKLIRMVNK